jgi:hypothetical protein
VVIAEPRIEPEVRRVLVEQTAPGFIGDRMAGIVRGSLEKRRHPPTTVTRHARATGGAGMNGNTGT